MTCWPKDKVPKRSSPGERWREHQLVSCHTNLNTVESELNFVFLVPVGASVAAPGPGARLLPLRGAAKPRVLSGLCGGKERHCARHSLRQRDCLEKLGNLRFSLS